MMNKHLQELYDEITQELTTYETDGDPELTAEEWLNIFYMLLVKTVNSIDLIGEED